MGNECMFLWRDQGQHLCGILDFVLFIPLATTNRILKMFIELLLEGDTDFCWILFLFRKTFYRLQFVINLIIHLFEESVDKNYILLQLFQTYAVNKNFFGNL